MAAALLVMAEAQVGLVVIVVPFLVKTQVVVVAQKAPWVFRRVATLLLLVVAERLEQVVLGQVLSVLILFLAPSHQPAVDTAPQQAVVRAIQGEMVDQAAAAIMVEQVVQRSAQHRGMMAALVQPEQVFMAAAAAVAQVLLEQTALALEGGMAGMAWRPQLTAAVQLEQAAVQVEHMLQILMLWVLGVQVAVVIAGRLLPLQTRAAAALVVWRQQA